MKCQKHQGLLRIKKQLFVMATSNVGDEFRERSIFFSEIKPESVVVCIYVRGYGSNTLS